MFTTYTLYSAILDRFYIDCTAHRVENRLKKHLSAHNGYTAKAKDWVILYREYFSTKEPAIARERQIKSRKRKERIKQLILRSIE